MMFSVKINISNVDKAPRWSSISNEKKISTEHKAFVSGEVALVFVLKTAFE